MLVNPSDYKRSLFGKFNVISPVLPPLGLMSIAAVLEKNGYEVGILDGFAENLPLEELVKRTADFGPDITGIPTNVSNFHIARNLCSEIKKVDKEIITVLGGPYATSETDIVKDRNVDYTIRGEAEFSFLSLVKNRGKWDGKISGLTACRNGKTVSNPKRIIEDINQLPIPAWHLIPIRKYRQSLITYKKLPATSTITSRGCPFNCIFCNKDIFGRKVRFFSIERVISELEMLKGYGFKDINFLDDIFTIDKERAIKLSEEIKRLDLHWSCQTRADLIDRKTLGILSRNNCYEIGYGGESGSERIQNFTKKGVTLDQVRGAVKLTKSFGMEVKLYLMIGFPTETEEDIMKTIEFAKEVDPDFVNFSIVSPLPGTELFDIVRDRIPDKTFDYFSMDFSINENLSAEELKSLQRSGYKSFYIRPGYLYKRLKSIRSVSDLKKNMIGLRSAISF